MVRERSRVQVPTRAWPKAFKVEKYWRSDDPYIVKQRIHGALSEFAEGRENL
ncbi:hypothetical protein P9202_519 [Prochlorococcus marinus str. MIT 9202]|nr:hypothetical protein P9202_519 [Prochlorococcus marinus str. MIT 9202]